MLEELPGDIGVRHRELAKVPERDLEAVQQRLRGHCGRPLPLADQRELPEMASRSESRDLFSADADDRFAVGDDEESDAAHLLLLHDCRPGLQFALAKMLRKPFQL